MILRIGIDVDGVIRNWSRAVVDIFYERRPELVKSEVIPDWGFSNIEISREELSKLVFDVWVVDLYSRMLPLKDALHSLARIQLWADRFKDDCELICVSDQVNDITKQFTKEFLRKHNLIPIFDEIYLDTGAEKWNYDLTYLVDDAPHNYTGWIEHGKDPNNFILMDSTYNQNIPAIHRISSLTEVPLIIKNSRENR